jgi:hypothetical protein
MNWALAVALFHLGQREIYCTIARKLSCNIAMVLDGWRLVQNSDGSLLAGSAFALELAQKTGENQ